MTMPAVRFLPEAVEDLLETQRWYGRLEPALARDFAEAVAAAVERIRRDPRSFPMIHGQIRRLVLRRFPYAVYFREQSAEILVIALHGRQDPRRLQQRT
jgi:plasmid stabilization system protein ParE